MEEDQESCGGMYINTLFDVNRAGFNHVAEIILTYLDYTSFFQFKRSSKIVYDFINKSNLEQVHAVLPECVLQSGHKMIKI